MKACRAETEKKREENRAKVHERIEDIMKFEMFAAKKMTLSDELDALKLDE